jgi:hypothetical protein
MWDVSKSDGEVNWEGSVESEDDVGQEADELYYSSLGRTMTRWY